MGGKLESTKIKEMEPHSFLAEENNKKEIQLLQEKQFDKIESQVSCPFILSPVV